MEDDILYQKAEELAEAFVFEGLEAEEWYISELRDMEMPLGMTVRVSIELL